jgi:nitrogen-specific signal transduction histidine kinase
MEALQEDCRTKNSQQAEAMNHFIDRMDIFFTEQNKMKQLITNINRRMDTVAALATKLKHLEFPPPQE